MVRGVNLVVHGDPGVVLPATACRATRTHQGGQQELLQRAAHGRGDNPGSHPNGSDTGVARWSTSSLPSNACLGQEIVACSRCFGQLLITAVAVKPDG